MKAPFFLRQQGVRPSRQDPHYSTIGAARELTHVDELWIRQRVEDRVRFGRIEQQHVIDRHWPGGDSLLHISGWPRVEKVLQAIEVVEALVIDPADVAPTTGGMFTTAFR